MTKCLDCNDTGEIMLFTSKVPCTCRKDVTRIHDNIIAVDNEAQRVNDAAAVRDAEVRALGFSLDEVREFARNIQSRLFNAAVTEDGEEEEIIAQELVRLLIRRTLREVVPNRQKMPGMRCGKTEYFRRMYGGKPYLSIDTSQVEMRLLAHLARKRETDREQRRPEA